MRILASNATEALNTAIAGLARPGDKLVTTAASHTRCCARCDRLADERGCEVVAVPPTRAARSTTTRWRRRFRERGWRR
ncbi:MAG: aminotransferase class V-fold PLP-dependent enzyme [Eggerthella lenta]